MKHISKHFPFSIFNFPFDPAPKSCDSTRKASSSGMALVIVLSLISLLLISSVTFAILMRIERASSANARNTIMARQYAKSALACAIAAIDKNIGTNRWPLWDAGDNNHMPDGLSAPDRYNPMWKYTTNTKLPLKDSGGTEDFRNVFFWKDTFASVDHSLARGRTTQPEMDKHFSTRRAPARIFSSKFQNYLPFGIRHRAYAQRYSSNNKTLPEPPDSSDSDSVKHVVVAPEWVPMTVGTNDVGNGVVGRYAFLALNTSGYLDIPALCSEGASLPRGFGKSAAEISPVKDFFKKGDAKTFKDNNQGRNFETVAEIIKANADSSAPGNKGNATPFADGAAYSAFNFAPVGRMPTNDIPNDLYNKFYVNGKFPFVDRICIAGDGSDTHIENLRKHKAAIITAFILSGLTKSSESPYGRFRPESDITDPPCNGCSVCGNGTPSYTLKREDVAEQALWAYLGLIDYIDDDDEPFFDKEIVIDRDYNEDIQQFARPATENTPLLNGFLATLRIFREEISDTVRIPDVDDNGNPTGTSHPEQVFDGTNVVYGVEFRGKVFFASRNSALPDTEAYDDILSRKVEAKIGFRFDNDNSPTGAWDTDMFASAARGIRFVGANEDEIEFDSESGSDGVVFKTTGDTIFAYGPICFFLDNDKPITITNKVELSRPIEDPGNNAAKEAIFGDDFPGIIHVGVAGLAKAGNIVIHRVPALEDTYDDPNVCPWLSSSVNSSEDNEDLNFKDNCYVTYGNEVYSSVSRAQAGGQKDYKLQKKYVNVVIWAEMIDPAFSCYGCAETLYPYDEPCPRPSAPSHIEHGNGNYNSWRRLSTAHPQQVDVISGFTSANQFENIIKGNASKNDQMNTRFDEVFSGNTYFIEENGGRDLDVSYSTAFQQFLLTDENAVHNFRGIRDGMRPTHFDDNYDKKGIDTFYQQFYSLHVRNDGLDSVGELGFLPIGPYATIRLCGFDDERKKSQYGIDYGLDEIDKDIALFNAIPYKEGNALYSKPFHRVLDFFSASSKPKRGLVNINSTDNFAMASIFNDIPLNDFLYDGIDDKRVENMAEDVAIDYFTPALREALKKKYEDNGLARNLSDIGYIYDTDEDIYADIVGEDFFGIDRWTDCNSAREAVIRNTCGLFTDRGLNISLLIRGEAFTPFFGRSDVKNELGTTLASRTAFAQIWRDTEPDADGNYPFFIQYFKIFDE